MKARNWNPSPVKVEFGAGMVMTDIAIDKDHTLTMYTEKEMVDKWDFIVYVQTKERVIDTLAAEQGEEGDW